MGRALAGVRAADKSAAESSGRLGRLAGAARAAQEEAARLEAAVASVAKQRERDAAALAELSAKLADAEPGAGEAGEPAEAEGEDAEAVDRDVLAAQASAAREAETDARLEVRTAEERLRAIAGRADALAGAAARERRAAEAAVARRKLRAQQAAVAGAVATGAEMALTRIAESLATAQADREAAEQASKGRTESLKEVRARVRALAADLDRVVDTAHGAEVSRAEQRMRLEQVAARAAEEFGVDPATLVAEYGPDVPVPVTDEEEAPPKRGRPRSRPAGDPAQPALIGGQVNGHSDELAAQNGQERPQAAVGGQQAPRDAGSDGGAPQASDDGAPEDGAPEDGVLEDGAAANGAGSAPMPAVRTVPYVRAEQEKRAATAQRQLDQLGKVNPLALEEFAALEERHQFLATQLEDLKKTRRDLLTVVKEVDDRVQQVFASAFQDTAAEFERIFTRLFPGGEGRLVLTEPDDMLATGIDVEARPPGKKVKRLSLLSGGERSLTAIGFLLAIFMARPSPFYVLDEVEAALDDTNLQRLLAICEELRASSQLIIVTHQKRTMEIADALYGTSMQGDGVSTVVSQRLRERERA